MIFNTFSVIFEFLTKFLLFNKKNLKKLALPSRFSKNLCYNIFAPEKIKNGTRINPHWLCRFLKKPPISRKNGHTKGVE